MTVRMKLEDMKFAVNQLAKAHAKATAADLSLTPEPGVKSESSRTAGRIAHKLHQVFFRVFKIILISSIKLSWCREATEAG